MKTHPTHFLSTATNSAYVISDYAPPLPQFLLLGVRTHETLADHVAVNRMGRTQRMNVQHDLLKELLGGNYVGPVRDLLARRPLQRQIKVLDLCTGTGKWYVTPRIFILLANRRWHLRRVVEMAEEFPHVKFNGLDIGVCRVADHAIIAC